MDIMDYAKKIYGFAYSKTKNVHDAEDLSQDILTQLFDKRIDFSAIENMDAYIYRICSYTWSNYLRKNKPVWNALNNVTELDFLHSDEDIEASYVQNEMYENLRRELMFLSKTRRDIMVMFYYDNKTGDEISEILNIPASTIRWHMRETKTILKERIEMNKTTEIYEPIRLEVGHSGWSNDFNMYGLSSDVIIQNICWICREKALTIEEIARTLGIAAVYIEDKIENLLHMDYLKLVGTNKYQTTFFIVTPEFGLNKAKFQFENISKIAAPIYNFIKDRIGNPRDKLNFDGEFSDDFLLAALLMPEIQRVNGYLTSLAVKEKNLSCVTPKRKDGSEHWVSAYPHSYFSMSDSKEISEDLRHFIKYSGNSVKFRYCDNVESMQFDLQLFGGWRVFENEDLAQMERVHEIIVNNEEPNMYDKTMIASLVEKGYVRVDNGKPVILVPYLTATVPTDTNVNNVLEDYFKQLEDYIDVKAIVNLLVENLERMDKYIPAYIDRNERNFHLMSCASFGHTAVMYTLFNEGYLQMPTEDEQKRICTYIWTK
jgi:RNA polymerase sigma factor, sigma-70 family